MHGQDEATIPQLNQRLWGAIIPSSAGVAQLVERQPSKLNVDGSSPFARFDECARIWSDAFAFVLKRQGFARVAGWRCVASRNTHRASEDFDQRFR